MSVASRHLPKPCWSWALVVFLGAGVVHAANVDGGAADAGGDAAREVVPDDAGVSDTQPLPLPLPTSSPPAPPSHHEDTATPAAGADQPAVAPASESRTVIKTIVGMLVLLTLAYLGGHPRVRRLEERLGISQAMAAGFPFVLLGMIARHPAVGVLTEDVLAEINPLLRVGLGCIGLVYGFRFDFRLLHNLPAGVGRLVVLSTALPFALVVAVSGALLALVSTDGDSLPLTGPLYLRDALCLGTAAAMSARAADRFRRKGDKKSRLIPRVIRLEELAGIIGLAVLAAYFRPPAAATGWQLPGTAWLLLTIGMGAVFGVLTFAILQTTSRGPEFLVLSLGAISFAAGAAGYLHLSPVVVTFIAGVLLSNFPGEYHTRLRDTLRRLERPILLLSLVIVGALWRLDDWRGWLLMPAFVGARFAGKWLATTLAHRLARKSTLNREERYALGIAPVGTLAIAIVINAKLLYPGGSIPLIVSAVLGGSLLNEVFVQWIQRSRQRQRHGRAASPAPAKDPS